MSVLFFDVYLPLLIWACLCAGLVLSFNWFAASLALFIVQKRKQNLTWAEFWRKMLIASAIVFGAHAAVITVGFVLFLGALAHL